MDIIFLLVLLALLLGSIGLVHVLARLSHRQTGERP